MKVWKLITALKKKQQEMAVLIYVNAGGKPPVKEHRAFWVVASLLGWLCMVAWLLGWPGYWVCSAIARAWKNRKDIFVYLDKYLGRFAWWKRLNEKRRLTMIERCNKSGHTLMGTLLENGQPGKMCQQCKYIQQITPKEFKTMFGVSVNKAIKKARSAGQQVMNAEKYLAIH